MHARACTHVYTHVDTHDDEEKQEWPHKAKTCVDPPMPMALFRMDVAVWLYVGVRGRGTIVSAHISTSACARVLMCG